MNEARFQIARRTFDFPAVFNEPSLDISNFIIMGKSTSDVDYYAETRIQIADSLTWTSGGTSGEGRRRHQRSARTTSTWNLFFPARIVFPNLAAFRRSRRWSSGGRSSRPRRAYPGISTTGRRRCRRSGQDDTLFTSTTTRSDSSCRINGRRLAPDARPTGCATTSSTIRRGTSPRADLQQRSAARRRRLRVQQRAA